MGDNVDEAIGGRWVLGPEIGRGGTAVVYAARDRLDFDRPVAIKISTRVDKAVEASMRREFSLFFGLHHPHIVSPLAFAQTSRPLAGHPRAASALVQELAPGQSLAAGKINGSDARTVAQIGAQVASALSVLHARGIRHGDITPANILFDPTHGARLIDFGFARRTPSPSDSSQPFNPVAGTLRYMAPEAMAGEGQFASDVYGLGATLTYLARGAPPEEPSGATLTSPLWQDAITAMTAAEPARRPTAEEVFSMFERTARAGDLRDLTLQTSRGEHRALRDSVASFLNDLQTGSADPRATVLTIAGPPRSGRSAALADGAATSVGLGLHVAGGRVLRLEQGLVSLERELAIESSPDNSTWARYEQIVDQLTRHQPTALFIDDADTEISAFVDYLFRLPHAPSLFVALVRKDDKAAGTELRTELIDDHNAYRLLRELRPLRPSDQQASKALVRASEGRIGPFVGLLAHHPGDALLAASTHQTFGDTAHSAPIPSSGQNAARVWAQLDDDVEDEAFADQFPELVEGSRVLLGRGFLVPGAGPGTHRATRVLRKTRSKTLSGAEGERIRHFVRRGDTPMPATAGRMLALEGQIPDAIRELLLAAKRSHERWEQEDALQHYSAILELEPSHEQARTEYANLLSAQGLHEAAIESLPPETLSDATRLVRARILIRAGRFTEAADTIPNETQNEDAEATRARALLLAGRYKEAHLNATRALKKVGKPGNRVELLDVLGMIAFYRGELEEAQQHLEESLSGVVEGALAERVRSHLAIVLHKTGALSEAESAYRKAIEGAKARRDLPTQLIRQNNLATLLSERGKFTEALKLYEDTESVAHILDDLRASVRARMNRANLTGWLGQTGDASRLAQLALNDATAHKMGSEVDYLNLILAESEIALNNLAAASQLLGRVSKRVDEQSNAFAEHQVVAAQLELRLGNIQRAFELAQGAYQHAKERTSLRIIAGSWVLLAAIEMSEGARPDTEKLGDELQTLTVARSDPDYGWLIAAARAQLATENSGESEQRQLARDLLETARSRLDAHYERSYSELWYRQKLWRTTLERKPTLAQEPFGRDLERLIAINRELVRDHDPDRLLDRIIDAAIALSGAERGFVVLVRDEWLSSDLPRKQAVAAPPREEDLEIYAGRNVDRESLRGEGFSRSIAVQAIRTGTSVATVDATGDERFREAMSVHELKLRSVLCLPLLTQARALGALYLDNRYRAHAFSETDVALLSAFADQAAIALANARMVKQLQTKAKELEHSRAEVDELNERLRTELHAQSAELRHIKSESAATSSSGRFQMIGVSEPMQRIYKVIERIADKEVAVTILGESGTGKELVARAIHHGGERREHPFVAVNCGAIPENLLESELFGHERGAFTGAVRSKPGLFEVAQDGTLFLDEIGDMPAGMQVKLLRVLQQREFRRVGGQDTLRTNTRIVSATHQNLEERVRNGDFREDLWYRLNVVEIRVPPLRDRRPDLTLLIDHFAERAGLPSGYITHEARAALLDYHWPGNIRELENELQRAFALAEERVERNDLSPKIWGASSAAGAPMGHGDLKHKVDAFERELIERTLADHRGRVSQAAKTLGLTRAGLYKKLHKHGLFVNKN